MGPSSIPRQLAAIERQYGLLDERVRRLLAATPDARWAERASTDAWSVAECFAHLNLTSAAMVPRMRAAWTEARGLGPAPTRYRPAMFGRILAMMVGPVPRFAGLRFMRVRTPPPFVPEGALPREQLVEEFEEWQAAERMLLREAATLPVDQVRIESPFAERASYDGYSALRILVRHEHRHLDQAERVWNDD